MSYEVVIKDQKTSDSIRKQIESLKEFKELLLLYQDKLIEVELHKSKKR